MNTPSVSRRSGSRKNYKGNVLVSLNWFLMFSELLFTAGLLAPTPIGIKIFCAVLMVLCLGFYAYVYLYFMKSDPGRLQSEGCNLEAQEMTILREGLNFEKFDVSVVPQPISLNTTQSANRLTTKAPAENDEE